jgi:hypothetical protein
MIAIVLGSLFGAFVLAACGSLAPDLQRGSWLAHAEATRRQIRAK